MYKSECCVGDWDIHNHLLPGVDDGASCMEECMDMLREEYRQGIRNLILTPHCRPGLFHIREEKRAAIFAQVCELAENELPDMNLYLGCEMHFNGRILKLLEHAENRMDSSDVVLVEFPIDMPFQDIVHRCQWLVNHGKRLIIAHVERYDGVYKDPLQLMLLKELGCLLQVNAETFLIRSWGMKRFVKKLMLHKLVDCVASDAHDMKYRPVNLSAARAMIERKYGPETAEQLFRTTIEHYLNKTCNNRRIYAGNCI